jgi:hypothetical protein
LNFQRKIYNQSYFEEKTQGSKNEVPYFHEKSMVGRFFEKTGKRDSRQNEQRKMMQHSI